MAEDGWNSPDPGKVALVYTDNPVMNTKQARILRSHDQGRYADSAIKLATKCKAFATEVLKQWRTEVADEPTDWDSLNEIRDL
jgi:hypothetical protein